MILLGPRGATKTSVGLKAASLVPRRSNPAPVYPSGVNALSRLRLLKHNVDHYANILFRGSKPRILYFKDKVRYDPNVGPRRHSNYNPLDDTARFRLSLSKEPQNEQITEILHEYRHRIVMRGYASPHEDYSFFRSILRGKEEEDRRLLVNVVYRSVPHKEDKIQELDAHLISVIATKLIDTGANADVVRRLLYSSPTNLGSLWFPSF
ncbi:hypothetical protein ACFL1W_00955 [Candidatus Margulisiibacteriota bacterium]